MRCQVLISLHALLAAGFFSLAAAQAEPMKILPLGDSITYGFPVPGGYRARLHDNLRAAAYLFQFFGTQNANATPALLANGQTAHEGHNGYLIEQLAANLNANDGNPDSNGGFWLARAPLPDIILLHIGTNDVLQNHQTAAMADRLDHLVSQIVALAPGAHLLVSSIIPVVDDAKNAVVQSYNATIRDVVVPKYAGLGKNVRFVDQYANFVDASGAVLAERLPGGSHPDQTGYDAMGDSWAAAIRALPLSYAQWKGQYFSPAQLEDESISGALADYDRDGIPNALEFFHRLNPVVGMSTGDTQALPALGRETVGVTEYLTITFRKNLQASQTMHTLLFSTTLQPDSWQSITPEATELLTPDPATGDPRYRMKINVTGMPKAFLRLAVTVAP